MTEINQTEQASSTSERQQEERVTAICYYLPSMMTLANALFGLMAIGETVKALHFSSLQHLQYASLFIVLAIIFDSFDGTVARVAGVSSFFGVELDSLCDAVSFGVAPAFLVYIPILRLREVGGAHPYLELISFPVIAIYMFCVLVRLARFNVEKNRKNDGHESFSGLPSPAAAGLCATGFLLVFHVFRDLYGEGFSFSEAVRMSPVRPVLQIAPAIVFGVALLMVSRIRYEELESRLIGGSVGFLTSLVLLGAISSWYVGYSYFLFALFVTYIGMGVVSTLLESSGEETEEPASGS